MCAHDRGIECFRMTILEQHVIGLAVPRFDPLSPVIDQTGSILATIFVRIRRRRKVGIPLISIDCTAGTGDPHIVPNSRIRNADRTDERFVHPFRFLGCGLSVHERVQDEAAITQIKNLLAKTKIDIAILTNLNVKQ